MTDPQPPAGLVCTGLTKSFGSVTVLKGIDFAVPAGSVIGLIGENGAGKSTLMNIIYGAVKPDAGTIQWEGREVVIANPARARRLVFCFGPTQRQSTCYRDWRL